MLLALHDVLPRVFTHDAGVIDQAQVLWPLFALMQPAGAIVFALDGILIGAGDARYLAGAMAFCFVSSSRSRWRPCTSTGASPASGGA